MTLNHVLLPCKMTSQRIPRKNLAVVGGRTLLDLSIDRFQAWYPAAMIWIATEDAEVWQIAERRGCHVYPLTERDLTDQRVGSDLFTEWLSHRERAERCCYYQVTSPFVFRYELDLAIADPRRYVRSGWVGHLVEAAPDYDGHAWLPLTQFLPDRTVLTGNFCVADGQHVVTMQDEATQVSPVSWLSAIDIDLPADLELAQRIADAMPLKCFDVRR